VRRIPQAVALVVSLSLAGAAGAAAATLEPVGDFEQPIFVTSDPDDPNRLFVVEREGRVMLADAAGIGAFADLGPLVSCCASERGLLSIALAPGFAASGRFYAAYTGTAAAGGEEGDVHVDAFRRAGENAGDLLREPIIAVGHAVHANHNGGQIQFGPDGYLYISTGDGGGGGDPLGSGQSLDTLLGKILRIDPRPGAEPAYEIPPDNPFAGETEFDEIWSYGLRNPWRFSFDRAGDDLVIADVGQGAREEVNHAPSPGVGVVGGAGANYGWNCPRWKADRRPATARRASASPARPASAKTPAGGSTSLRTAALSIASWGTFRRIAEGRRRPGTGRGWRWLRRGPGLRFRCAGPGAHVCGCGSEAGTAAHAARSPSPCGSRPAGGTGAKGCNSTGAGDASPRSG